MLFFQKAGMFMHRAENLRSRVIMSSFSTSLLETSLLCSSRFQLAETDWLMLHGWPSSLQDKCH